jgi:hypothetical protein
VLSQDDGVVLFLAHLIDHDVNGGLPICALADLPAPIDEGAFDAAEYVSAFWRAGPPSTVRN